MLIIYFLLYTLLYILLYNISYKYHNERKNKQIMMTEEESKRFNELSEKLYANGFPKKADFDDILTDEECQEFVDLEQKYIAQCNYYLLDEIQEEAFERVWLDRSSIGTENEEPGIPKAIRKRALKAQKRIIKKYKISPEKCDDYYHGYWSGILALSRFLLGYSSSIEDLREGNELLDT